MQGAGAQGGSFPGMRTALPPAGVHSRRHQFAWYPFQGFLCFGRDHSMGILEGQALVESSPFFRCSVDWSVPLFSRRRSSWKSPSPWRCRSSPHSGSRPGNWPRPQKPALRLRLAVSLARAALCSSGRPLLPFCLLVHRARPPLAPLREQRGETYLLDRDWEKVSDAATPSL